MLIANTEGFVSERILFSFTFVFHFLTLYSLQEWAGYVCGEVHQPKQAEAEVHKIEDGGQPSCEQKGSENGRKMGHKRGLLEMVRKVLSLHSGSTLKPERN